MHRPGRLWRTSAGTDAGGRTKQVMKVIPYRLNRALLLAAVVIAAAEVRLAAQTATPSPAELIRAAVNNEVAANDQGVKFMYVDRREDEHGSSTRLAVETTQATASILIALDGKPLTAQQRQAEQTRLQGMLDHPEEIRRKQKAEKEDDERTTKIVKALPDAFVFEADGEEPGESGLGRPGAELVRLKFRPNPSYKPPTRIEQVLAGMQGTVLIDARRYRIARIDGTLIKEVSFGWGIFGHLDKGGHFLVQQCEMGDGAWEISKMSLDFTGKILIFKNLRIQSTQVLSDFRPVPANLTFAQGVKMLEERQSEVAGNRAPNGR